MNEKPITSKHKSAYTTKQGSTVMLTPQQHAYAEGKLNARPTESKLSIIKRINPHVTNGTAKQLVKQYETNHSIATYTNEQLSQARNNIVTLANDIQGVKPETRLKANQDIIDRNEGRAVQKIHQTTEGIQINIDLTSSLEENTSK